MSICMKYWHRWPWWRYRWWQWYLPWYWWKQWWLQRWTKMRRILGGLELVSAWEPEVDVMQISTLVIPKIAIAIIIIIITIITIIIIVVFNLSKKTQTLILRGPVLKPCVPGSVAFQHRFLFLMRFAAFLNDPGSKINFPLYQVSRSYWPLSGVSSHPGSDDWFPPPLTHLCPSVPCQLWHILRYAQLWHILRPANCRLWHICPMDKGCQI